MISDHKVICSILETHLKQFEKNHGQTDQSRTLASLIAQYTLFENKDRVFSNILMFYKQLSDLSALKRPGLIFALKKIFKIPTVPPAHLYKASLFAKNLALSTWYSAQDGELENRIKPYIDELIRQEKTQKQINDTTSLPLPLCQLIDEFLAVNPFNAKRV